jgi:hypothetical protein
LRAVAERIDPALHPAIRAELDDLVAIGDELLALKERGVPHEDAAACFRARVDRLISCMDDELRERARFGRG